MWRGGGGGALGALDAVSVWVLGRLWVREMGVGGLGCIWGLTQSCLVLYLLVWGLGLALDICQHTTLVSETNPKP